jgi:hypothetical protein
MVCLICQMGYWKKNGGCCYGIDDQTSLSHPLHFGFDEFVATPECAASATTNCGCFFWPSPHNNTPCELGHYAHPGGDMEAQRSVPYLECMQYYVGNATAAPGPSAVLSVEPMKTVSPVDDNDFLVGHCEGLVLRALASDKPFLCVVFFHGAEHKRAFCAIFILKTIRFAKTSSGQT